MTFFFISLSIIITAQISYVIAFSSRYWKSLDTCEKIAMTLMILPMSPFMSIAIYIAEKKNIFGTAYNENNGMNLTKSPLRKWMDKKLRSHLGFILEATIEAFPQSILQMCAIVYYEEYTNYVAILSILISMWSVCSKSFVFAAGTSLDRYSIIFNWLCVVCSYVTLYAIRQFDPQHCAQIIDFFGLFFIISWVFRNELMFSMFYYQVTIGILPLISWLTFCFWIFCLRESFKQLMGPEWENYCCCCCICCGLCVLVPISVFVGITCIFSTMLLQIFH